MQSKFLIVAVLLAVFGIGISAYSIFSLNSVSGPVPVVNNVESKVKGVNIKATTTVVSDKEEDIFTEVADLKKRVDALEDSVATTTADSVLYEYKYVTNIDPCQLNKLVKKNWQVQSLGTVVDGQTGVYDEQCVHLPSTGPTIDWALLQRKKDK